MSRPAPGIRLSTKERETLLSWTRSSKSEQRMAQRAKVVLLADSGLSGKEIALRMATREARVSKWLGRFAKDRLGGLQPVERAAFSPAFGRCEQGSGLASDAQAPYPARAPQKLVCEYRSGV